MEIKISCQGAITVSLDDLLDLQGDLKDLTQENYNKLRDSIIKFGFSFPVFIWLDPNGNKWTIDSHQRQRVLKKMRDEEGYAIPPLPADIIFADSKTQAKEKLLLLNSRYGHMTQEGFDEFTADLPIEDVSDLLALDSVMIDEKPLQSPSPDETEDTPQVAITCPQCGHTFTPSV